MEKKEHSNAHSHQSIPNKGALPHFIGITKYVLKSIYV